MRFFYLDNLRAILMVLGVVLHTCAAFSPHKYWIVSYTYSISWIDSVNQFIHLFRMPLFFIISGFFAALLLNKRTSKEFLYSKLLRIALPCMSALLLINLPQYGLLQYLAEDANEAIKTGPFIGHLWFLSNLLIYCLLYSVLHKAFVVFARVAFKQPTLLHIIAIILICPGLFIVLLALNKIGVPIYHEIPIVGSVYQIFSFFDFFIAGVLFFLLSHQSIVRLLGSTLGLLSVSIIALVFVFPWWQGSAIGMLLDPYAEHIVALVLSLVILALTYFMLKNKGAMFTGVADMSYTIYLFHHVIIVLLILFMNYLNTNTSLYLPPLFAFTLVIVFTLGITVPLHRYVVAKSKILRLLFNGKY